MILADLLFSIQSEIETVLPAEIIHRINLFILKHRLPIKETKVITPETEGYKVLLNSRNTFLQDVFVNDKKVSCGLTKENFFLHSGENKYNVFTDEQIGLKLSTPMFTPIAGDYSQTLAVSIYYPQTEEKNTYFQQIVGFGFPLKTGDVVKLEGTAIANKLDLNTQPEQLLPFPEIYEYALICFILKDFFKTLKYLNMDMFSYYIDEYNKSIKVIRQTASTPLVKSIGTW